MAPTPSPADVARERKYQAEDALRTLTRAAEIRKNTGLMREVKKMATQQIKAVTKASGR